MSFKSNEVVPVYKTLIGWRQHYDATDFQIDNALTTTDSGEYFQQKHAGLNLEYIKATIPTNRDLDEYLETTVEDSINEIFNDLLQYRQVNEYGKTLLQQSTLLNKYGWVNDVINNQNRFVGFQIRTRTATGLMTMINEIGLQFTGVEDLTLYLFHSSKKDPLHTFNVTTQGDGDWTWKEEPIELSAFNRTEYHGGTFVLGYYQEDVSSNAINYTNFNWDRGECGNCGHSYRDIWNSIKKHFTVYPIYVPSGSFTKGEMFDLNNAMYNKSESYGINLKLSVKCDLTDFFIDNKMAFKNLLGLKVVWKILQDMKFSQNINYIEENIKMMIIRDLEGDKETNMTNIPSQYKRELKAVSFNISGINSQCLGCQSDSYEPSYGVV